MNILGMTMPMLRSLFRAAPATTPPALAPVSNGQGSGRGWFGVIRESFAGAWQQNKTLDTTGVLRNATVFACVTLIAADVGKLRPKLLGQDGNVWIEETNPAYSPVLRKPNPYQNHIQFVENWLTSKLTHGNAYVLKQRDNRGVVVALFVLSPMAVVPLVAPDGSVYYQLHHDNLAGLNAELMPAAEPSGKFIVPASEIIHDRMNCLFHPLVGLSPLFAAALPAMQGLTIGGSQNLFFANSARPSGVLTAPGAIGDDTAKRLADFWNQNFTGENSGRVAVLGDGLKFEGMTMTAVDAQLIEQMKWSAETICSVFHVPTFKVGVGILPTHLNGELLNQIYYTDCLQSLIESWELCMDEGLSLDLQTTCALDLTGLLRMDQTTRFASYSAAIAGGWLAPNEARALEDLPPVEGGDTPYMQQQNYALSALAKRPPPSNTPPPNVGVPNA